MSTPESTLLPDGIETSFAEIESTIARVAPQEKGASGRGSAGRSLVATMVVVGPPGRLRDAADALKPHAEAGGIRAIVISSGGRTTPGVRVSASTIALQDLRPDFINNAVAALRLPSLPALLWWRGGEPEELKNLARLADRVVLDAENPEPLWARAVTALEDTPVSDLRWTALTRWRALMAHFFDMPGVPAAAARFTRLRITGTDTPSARLFAGWLRASLDWQRRVQFEFDDKAGAAVDAVTFGDGREELSLRRLPGGTCVEARARLDGREATRITSLGDQSLAALIAAELRLRAHDRAFESAVRAAQEY